MPARGARTPAHPHRFPASLKLTRAADFDSVFKEGQRSADSLFTVLYRPGPLPHARLGMTTPARRIGTAVARNRLRRLVRESFRRTESSLVGLDIVVMAKEAAAAADNSRVFNSLASHWSRLARAVPAS